MLSESPFDLPVQNLLKALCQGERSRTPLGPREARGGEEREGLIVEIASRIQDLADRCQRLADENRSLRQQQEHLVGERSQLLAKNEQARSRVEAMISRLKSLEQHT